MDMFTGKLPVLRDDLAVHRTTLANERTMLAYLRTALTLFAAGVTFIKFFDSPLIIGIGWLSLPVSVIVLFEGVLSFRKMRREIIKDEEKAYDEARGE